MRKAKSYLIIGIIVSSFLFVLDNNMINGLPNQDIESQIMKESIQFAEIGRFDDNYGYPNKFEVINDLIYIASIDGLLMLNVSVPSSPSFLGFYNSKGDVIDFELKNNFAYLASRDYGLEIIDVTNPVEPSFVSYCENTEDALGINIKDNLVYLACGVIDLKIVNITNIFNPVLIGEFRDPNDEPIDPFVSRDGLAQEVYVKDNVALIADGEDGINLVDVQIPTNPELISIYEGLRYPVDFCVKNDLLFVTEYSYGMTILNFSDPTSLFNLSSYYPNWTSIRDVYVEDEVAYLAQQHWEMMSEDDVVGGLDLVNISNPSSPIQIEKICLNHSFFEVFVHNGIAFLNEDNEFLTVVDVTIPSSTILTIYDFGGSSQHITKKDDNLFVLDFDYGLEIIEISDASRPNRIGQINIEHDTYGIVVSDDYAFVKIYDRSIHKQNLLCYSIKNPSEPSFIEHHEDIRIWDFSIQNSYLYVSGNGFRVYEINDNPYSLTRKTSISQAGFFALEGDYAYLFNNDYVLNIIDVGNPNNIFITRTLTLDARDGRFAYDVAVKNGIVAISNPDLNFIDVSDPFKPKNLSDYHTSYFGYSKIEIFENIVFASVDYYQYGCLLEILNIIDPENPVKIADFKSDSYIYDFTFDGKYLYLVEGFDGLKIIEILGLPVEEPNTISLETRIFFSVPVIIVIYAIIRTKPKKILKKILTSY